MGLIEVGVFLMCLSGVATSWCDECQMESDDVLSHSGACHHGSPVKAASVSGRAGRWEAAAAGGAGGGLRASVRAVMDEDGARGGRGMK